MKSFIASAHATGVDAAATAAPATAAAGSSFMTQNIMMIVLMVVMFYVLLIRPQQKRFKKHTEMLNSLKKGDRVLTSAGFIGRIDQITDGEKEVVVDLGNGLKVTALRSTIQGLAETEKAAAQDNKKGA